MEKWRLVSDNTSDYFSGQQHALGLLISLMFFLSATWHVYPYFYGSDIVFVSVGLHSCSQGPLNTGLPALDTLLVQRVLSPRDQKSLAPLTSLLLGVGEVGVEQPSGAEDYSQGRNSPKPGTKRPAQQQSRYSLAQQARNSRRNFLLGVLTGGAGILGLTWLWNVLHLFPADSSGGVQSGDQSGVSNATATPTSGTSSSGTPAVAASPIAQANAVQNNSAVNFTIASNGDPGILVRLNDGKFVAYDATCTHAGCPVDYDPGSQMLVCPCHGATFDPAKAAAVVQGPADTPLTTVPIHVDSTTGRLQRVNSKVSPSFFCS